MFLSFCQTRLKGTSMRDAYIYNRSDNGFAVREYNFSIMVKFCLYFFPREDEEGIFFFLLSLFQISYSHLKSWGYAQLF